MTPQHQPQQRDWCMHHYKMRVTTVVLPEWEADLLKFVDCLRSNGSQYHFGGIEIGKRDGRTHFHGYFTHWSPRPQSVQKFVKEYFAVTGGDYECVPMRSEDSETFPRYWQYCVKQGVCLYSTRPSEDVERYINLALHEKREYEANAKKRANKNERDKKRTRDEHYENLRNNVIPKFLKDHEFDHWDYMLEREIIVPVQERRQLRLDECCHLVAQEYKQSYCTYATIEPVIHRLMFEFCSGYESTFANRLHERLTR